MFFYNFFFYNTYIGVVPITNKFYSKYDTEYINLEKNLKINKYLNLIENTNNGYNRNVESNK